jgi:molybdenum cofactor biosynthesis protein MoaC
MLTHIDNDGNAKMVDISKKNNTDRIAVASGYIELNKETIELVKIGNLKKGDVLTVAKIAGIQASKKTSSLIPLCHNINLNKINIQFNIDTQEGKIYCNLRNKTIRKTWWQIRVMGIKNLNTPI